MTYRSHDSGLPVKLLEKVVSHASLRAGQRLRYRQRMPVLERLNLPGRLLEGQQSMKTADHYQQDRVSLSIHVVLPALSNSALAPLLDGI